MTPWHAPSRWLVTAVAVLIVYGATFLWIPGINVELAREAGTTSLPIFGSSATLGFLVLFRGLAAVSVSRGTDLTPVYAFLYLLCTAIWGFSLALGLESINSSGEAWVLDPGYWFRLQTILTLTAGSAVVWALARWVSRAGVGSGPLVLFGAVVLGDMWNNAYDFGVSFGFGWEIAWDALAPFVALAIAAMGLALWSPRWPFAVTPRLALRSPVDLLALPLFALWISPVLLLLQLNLTVVAELMPAAVYWILPAVGCLTVSFGLVGLLARAEGHRRPWAWGVGVAALLCAVLAPAHGFVATGGLARAMAPGPFDGNQTVTIELNASEAPSGDADVLRTRLQHLKIDATLSGAGADWTLELRDVVGAEEVLSAVLPRRALSIHEVLEDETRMARPSSVPTELANTLTVQECFDQTAERRFCTPMVVRPAVITKDDIANAWMTHNEWDGNVVAMVVFTDQGAQTMGDFSEALVGRRFAIVMDGEVLSAPRVNEPIRGGRAQITLGHQDNAEMEVQALVAALTTASLEGTWTARTSTPGR